MLTLTDEESARYERQMALAEIGREGQLRLRNAHVFIAGLGGLGSVLAYYMAAAGVGRLTVVDRDRVEVGNLNRQILHRTEDIGKPKAVSAREKLLGLNPSCRVEALEKDIHPGNVDELTADCHLILDGTDNFETRRLLNRVSVVKGIPFLFGGVDGWNGMVSAFIPGETPCFECLFPGERDAGKKGVAVVGPVPGMVASIQALQAIRLITGLDGILKGRLLYVRGSDITFKEIDLQKNPHCRICGPGGLCQNG